MVSTRSKRTRSAKKDPDATEGKEDVPNKKSKKTRAMNTRTVDEVKGQRDKNTGENETEAVSSISEKGIIYFFFKGRVGVEEPQGIQDVARSYIVLRPISIDSKVETSSLNDSRHARLLVLPKKTLPKKHGRGFLAFVKTPASSLEDLREELSGGEYDTKTRGKRQVPSAKPFAEGMYAIISKDQRSHLVYRITFPAIGDVQKEFGVHERGSYIVSAKNPKFPSPGSVSLGEPPKYPEKIQKYFRDLRWVPLVPELLDYENTQLLIIGEGLGIMRQAAESRSDDEGDKQSFEEETEELQNEDGFAHLEESDPTFTMLDSNLEDHLKMKTTW